MRTTQAQIKLIWKNGIIYLSVTWRTRILQSTGFKVDKKYWDAAGERVKRPATNYAAINATINKLKTSIIQRRDAYILQGVEYTSRMLLEEPQKGDMSLNSMLQQMAEERGLKFSTVENYETALKRWSEYTPVADVRKIDVPLLRGFMTFLRTKGCKDGTIKTFFLKIEGLVNFAIEKKVIKENPFHSFKFHRQLKVREHHPALTKFQMEQCLEYLGEMFCVSGDAWDRLIRKLNRKLTPENVIGLFCFSYLAGGLAPIDCLLLRPSDIEEKIINGKSYYVANLKRSKTGQPVNIFIKIVPASAALINALKERGGQRLFSILEGVKDADNEVITKRKRYLAGQGQAVLRGVLGDVNERIILHNRAAAIPEPLINLKEVTFYSARHTLATVLANSNVGLNAISSVMGRSVEGIGRYIKSLNNDIELANALENIYGKE